MYPLRYAVARSYAILSSAKLISQQELSTLAVNAKIGSALGLIDLKGVDMDELTLLCEPYSLVRLTKCGDTPEERDEARARTVRKTITDKEE